MFLDEARIVAGIRHPKVVAGDAVPEEALARLLQRLFPERIQEKTEMLKKVSADIRAAPDGQAAVIDQLTMTYDWFTCWTIGTLHQGGNTTWYYTKGDVHGKWGYVGAVDLKTPNTFDQNPTAYGLAKCE